LKITSYVISFYSSAELIQELKHYGMDMLVYLTPQSDVRLIYFAAYTNETIETFFQPVPSKKLEDFDGIDWNISSPVLFLTSNCGSGEASPWSPYVRIKLAEDIMKHLPIDSYGKCLNNKVMIGSIFV
jgi:hypothetical protein